MKRAPRPLPLAGCLGLGCLFALMLTLSAPPLSSAQFNCTQPPTETTGDGWKRGATV